MNQQIPSLSQGLHKTDHVENQQSLPEGMSEREKIQYDYGRQRDMSKVTYFPAKKAPGLNDLTGRLRVVVYCRVSTDGLSQATSFELQKSYYLQFVRKHIQWKLIAMYSDEGITATSTEKRIGLLQMLEDAKAGKFDVIIVKNLSRLSRNLMDCMNIIYALRNLPNPVGIFFESENLYTLDKSADFTLQVLSLVAQEESHKKSEAMLASYYMRFSQGQYLVPDLLGYRKTGKNQIAIDVEEAKTVQLIFMMYMAGYSPKTIAQVLTKLGRKTHTHVTNAGVVKEGVVKWTADSVRNVLKNERRCGDVLAQKTVTESYLTHKSKPNNDILPQFYAIDQHQGIVSPEDFLLTQRLIAANRGGWEGDLPNMHIYSDGALKGFVSVVPRWCGYASEDYNRASLRAYGVEESELVRLGGAIESDPSNRGQQVMGKVGQSKGEWVNSRSPEITVAKYPDDDPRLAEFMAYLAFRSLIILEDNVQLAFAGGHLISYDYAESFYITESGFSTILNYNEFSYPVKVFSDHLFLEHGYRNGLEFLHRPNTDFLLDSFLSPVFAFQEADFQPIFDDLDAVFPSAVSAFYAACFEVVNKEINRLGE